MPRNVRYVKLLSLLYIVSHEENKRERDPVRRLVSRGYASLSIAFGICVMPSLLIKSAHPPQPAQPPRRSSVDVDPNRAETFKAPKRYGTEPHIALSSLMNTSSDHDRDHDHDYDESDLFRLHERKNDLHTKDQEPADGGEHQSHRRREHKRVGAVQAVKDVGHVLNEHSKHSPGPRGPHVP